MDATLAIANLALLLADETHRRRELDQLYTQSQAQVAELNRAVAERDGRIGHLATRETELAGDLRRAEDRIAALEARNLEMVEALEGRRDGVQPARTDV